VKGTLYKCVEFDNSKIDIKPSLKNLLNLNYIEKQRKAELKILEKEFAILGNAMDDDKIKRMQELQEDNIPYTIDFDGVFIPASPQKMLTIAPQLAFYDIDFSSGVLFFGPSSWDSPKLLQNKGEHMHFSRFLSLKSDKFKKLEKIFTTRYNHSLSVMSGFASDILFLAQDLDLSQNIYRQLYRPYGFSVLTGNVRFSRENMPERVYGINKIARRKIRTVENVKHQRPASLPRNLDISKDSVFDSWFGF
jgi:hypothetical protein